MAGISLRIVVGIIARIAAIPLQPLLPTAQASSSTGEPTITGLMLYVIPIMLKIIAGAVGAFVGGRQRKKLLAAHYTGTSQRDSKQAAMDCENRFSKKVTVTAILSSAFQWLNLFVVGRTFPGRLPRIYILLQSEPEFRRCIE